MSHLPPKSGLHPRNRFRDGYDFSALVACTPALSSFVRPNAYGNPSIDFGDARAVKALNQALLHHAFGLDRWDIPDGALCPPIPGRSDHVHHLADLLATSTDSRNVPRGRDVRVLDIGTGANCIYPLLGACEYGWSFVATDVDERSLAWAREVVSRHASVAALVELRRQPASTSCFDGVVKPGERFDLSMCNPPFYASAEDAARRNETKRQNLARGKPVRAGRNFGGHAGELRCDGGELGFVQRMIEQSAERPDLCTWFTSLISDGSNLRRLRRALDAAGAAHVEILDMSQGQKKSRILAWSFQRVR